MRRLIGGIAAFALLSLTGANPAAAVVVGSRSPTQICKAAAQRFAKLAVPTSLSGLPSVFDQALRILPTSDNLSLDPASQYADLISNGGLWPLMIALPTGYHSKPIATAVKDGDGPVANKDLADLQRVFARIDRERKKEGLPAACSSKAFGASYFPAIAALVKTGLALTGNFSTDANAACARLDKRSTIATNDISSLGVEEAVSDLDEAFRAFQIDMRAIAPPPGSPAAYTTFRQVIDQAVKTLDHANDTLHGATNAELQQLKRQIGSLAQPVTSAANALGLQC